MCTILREKQGLRPHIGRLTALLLAVLLLAGSAIPAFAASNERYLNYLFKDIYVDGYHINNYQLENPVCIYGGSAYVPLDDAFKAMLGLDIKVGGGVIQLVKTEPVHYKTPSDLRFYRNHFDDRIGTPIYSGTAFFLCESFADPAELGEKAKTAGLMLSLGKQLAGIYQNTAAASDPDIPQSAGFEMPVISETAASAESLPLKTSDFCDCGEVLYVRLTALTALEQLPYTAYFDSVGGLSISTDASVSAQYLFSNNNRSYIEGRTAYMKNAQPALSDNDALILEYLFRHEATVYGLSQDLLMAVSRTESTYDLSLLERKSPIGLMQLMPRTVEYEGWTVEEVRDKHGNIEFGAKHLSDLLARYGGNVTKTLSAYNWGTGSVARGTYNTNYANKVTTFRSNIVTWCGNRSYASKFLEVSERVNAAAALK
ncbi:MAG: lytic transglycosylase domain-containing protein [Firmicutes bacterium]|nr:lytic transglycosylase domain-containing protein [Bacillota bacterium]